LLHSLEIHFLYIFRSYEDTPIGSPRFVFYWKYDPFFFHILNDNMYMMLSVGCFWIFNQMKRCGKVGSVFLIKNNCFLTYEYEPHCIGTIYGFTKAVSFKILYNG
jgi:hypothetical protein